LNTEKATWYITRSAGITAYMLLWLSTALGLAIPTRLFGRLLNGNFIYDFHEYISLLSLGFMALHVLILLADQYMRFTVVQILFPFLSPYKPFWVGIGVIGFYLVVIATVAFYARKRLGNKTFKFLHAASLLGYLGATAHGFFAGTDSSLIFAQLMYSGSFLVVVFLTVMWLMLAAQKKFKFAR
jgi:predicted ferric reductase